MQAVMAAMASSTRTTQIAGAGVQEFARSGRLIEMAMWQLHLSRHSVAQAVWSAELYWLR